MTPAACCATLFQNKDANRVEVIVPLQSKDRAPYAPAAAVTGFLHAFRDKTLPTPITLEVLTRAGVSPSLAPRTL